MALHTPMSKKIDTLASAGQRKIGVISPPNIFMFEKSLEREDKTKRD